MWLGEKCSYCDKNILPNHRVGEVAIPRSRGKKRDLIQTGYKNHQLSAIIHSENGKVSYMEELICLFVSLLNCKSSQSHLKGPVLKNVHNLYTVLTLFFNTEVLASNPCQNYKTQHEVWNSLVFPMPFMKSLSEEGYIIIIKDTHVKMQAQPKRRQAGEKIKSKA